MRFNFKAEDVGIKVTRDPVKEVTYLVLSGPRGIVVLIEHTDDQLAALAALLEPEKPR